jgi:hypothetical protein
MLDGEPIGRIGDQSLEEIFDSDSMREMRRLHIARRAGEIGICSRCYTTIPHPVLVAGSLVFHGKWVRKALPAIERMVYLSKWLPKRFLTPPSPKKVAPVAADLVQIQKRD